MFTQDPVCPHEKNFEGLLFRLLGPSTSIIEERDPNDDDYGPEHQHLTNGVFAKTMVRLDNQRRQKGSKGVGKLCIMDALKVPRNSYNLKKLMHLLVRLVTEELVTVPEFRWVPLYCLNLEKIKARKDDDFVNSGADMNADCSSSEEWSEDEDDGKPPAKRQKANPEETKGPACPNQETRSTEVYRRSRTTEFL
jgi:hypothetical protein